MELGKLTIPTDRMSKFLVVFGIVGTIAALYLAFKYSFLIHEQAGMDAVKIAAYSKLYNAELAVLSPAARAQVPTIERLSALHLKIAELKVDQDVVKHEQSLLHLWQVLGVVFWMPFFGWAMRLGFRWWHSEEMRHSANGSLDDMITRLERMQTELNSKAVNLAAKSEKDVARDAQPEG